jgi:hypothetical protein
MTALTGEALVCMIKSKNQKQTAGNKRLMRVAMWIVRESSL